MSRVEHLMGTTFTITVHDPGFLPKHLDRTFEWLRAVERTFTTFDPGSEISLLGRGALSRDEVSGDVRHVLARCEELEELTEHRFSITSRRPDAPGIDPAAFVKGWAADEAALRLRLEGIRTFAIDAGGDVLCVGPSPGGERWEVGIRHPVTPELLGATVRIPSGAAATSGTYFRGEHIWGDGLGDRRVASVTVVGPSLGVADALATAIFSDQARSLAWMVRFPDYGVALMTTTGRLRWTASLDDVIVPAWIANEEPAT